MTINEFWTAYTTAFSSFDADGIFNAMSVPLSFASPTRETEVIRTANELRGMLGEAFAFYQSKGVKSVQRLTTNTSQIFGSFEQSNICWRLLDGNNEKIIDFDSTYITRKQDDQRQIVFIISHNERERFAQT